MTRRASSGRIVLLEVDGGTTTPLYRRVYDAIRTRILDGSLRRGAPLPSSRALAGDLDVSRSTVILAYEQLRAEGYIEGRMGAPTRVSATLPDRSLRAPGFAERRPSAIHGGRPSARAMRIVASPRERELAGKPPRAFRVAVPAVDIFPVDTWGRILAKRWGRAPARALAYGDPFGYLPLREAIAEYLASARGVRCEAAQIMIVNGSQEGLDIACRVVLDPGDSAWMEDPGYFGARGALTAAGAHIANIPVDEHGLVVKQGIRQAPDAKLAFVTPARQMPLGVTLSLARRLELIEWARASNAWIFEDDYDSEFRYTGRPLAALHGLDPDGTVIYSGTFSKVTFPSLRLGYVVVPPMLVEAFEATRHFLNYSPPYLEQAVLCDFMTEGHFERHIRRTRAVYHERQQLLVELARRELAGGMTVSASDSGMNLIGWLPEGSSDLAVAKAARLRDVDVIPVTPFSIRVLPPGVMLGYAGVRDREMREGVTRLAMALEDCSLADARWTARAR
ncbi:MAG: PLP-dependent aminotransferase family protein [Gemmatimonadota bacterium]